MKRALILAAASTFALATPALAQHAGHTAPRAAQSAAQPTGDPSCPAEHAAMGHCTPKAAAAAAPPPSPTQTPAAPRAAPAPVAPDPSCPPDHAAMGHCTPKPSAASSAPAATPDPHVGHNMSAPSMPSAAPASTDPSCPPEHAAMGHCTPNAGAAAGTASIPDPHAGHNMGNAAAPGAPPVAPPPPGAFSGPEHAADAVFDPKLMAQKRAEELIDEHGGYVGYMVLIDRLEARIQDGREGYAWEGDAWYGGDYNRLWIKSEGEGEFGGSLESAEVQALYSRAIDPWFNLQAGVRYDTRPQPGRAHLVLGVLGLAPYWFEIDGAAFLSEKGDLTARFEAEYDQRITNRLILQPRVEFDLAAQDVPELGIGSGLSSAEAGLRLRYEIKREFAPYIGVEYERRFGDTARFARTAGEKVGGWAFLVGLRSWF